MPTKRVPGGLKHLGGSIPDNFNDPIDDFDFVPLLDRKVRRTSEQLKNNYVTK